MDVEGSGDGSGMTLWNNCLVWVCCSRPEVSDMARANRFLRTLRGRHPQGIGFFLVITDRSPIPVSEARQKGVDMLREHADAFQTMTTVIEGRGFRAAATRASISGIGLATGRRLRLHIHATVDDGVRSAYDHLRDLDDRPWSDFETLGAVVAQTQVEAAQAASPVQMARDA